MPEDERPIPFKRMVYVGDGETDIPAMKMINYQGGKSIAVYNPNQRTTAGRRSKILAEELVAKGRANYVAAADYRKEKGLYRIIRYCIDGMAAENELMKFKK